MKPGLSEHQLQRENQLHRGTGGTSQENRAYGFRPAFLDTETGAIYPSCFTDGRPAPCHILDGLPQNVVAARAPSGRAMGVKGSVISGFVRGGRFYTREQALQEIMEITPVAA
ncbi:MAG: hypothetical protein L0191_15240 [Acidobacteria bacterium]|nr:hypothetical protein [Acidobacteriota bacterium]